MTGLFGIYIVWGIGAVQVLGLLSACVARLAEGSRGQAWFQRLFFVCLLLVGLAATVASGVGPGCWMLSNATLAVMVLMATFDPCRSGKARASV
ncbi:MAG: hypothetical protein ABR915_14800 [Thermoguttaceae bacterium]|jgi:choline-glycine betaine transporter